MQQQQQQQQQHPRPPSSIASSSARRRRLLAHSHSHPHPSHPDGSTSVAIPSTSHEYARASWYAAHASRTHAREMVDEESEHRPVWGLARGAPPVVVPFTRKSKSTVNIQAYVRTIDDTGSAGVVGLMETPAVLLELVLVAVVAPSSSASTAATTNVFDAFLAEAAAAYVKHFELKGLSVHYTRKH